MIDRKAIGTVSGCQWLSYLSVYGLLFSSHRSAKRAVDGLWQAR